jgi:hypothetical protein
MVTRRLVSKWQDHLMKKPSLGISNVLNNKKAELAIKKIEEKNKNNNKRIIIDSNKKDELLKFNKKLQQSKGEFTENINSNIRFEISSKTKENILQQIKHKKPIDDICFEFMVEDVKFQKEIFSGPNLGDNKIFINFLSKRVAKMLVDDERELQIIRDAKKPFDPNKYLKSKKIKQDLINHSGVFKFKQGTLSIPKSIWVTICSGGLPSLGKRSR